MPSKRFVRRNIKRATKRNTHRNAGHGHKWTSFEMTAVLGMICRNEHNTLSTTAFAAALNEALGCGHENDISTDDVGELLSRIQVDKKAAMAFVERQPRPQVLTRAKKRAFERSIPFDGSMMEWLLEGRKNWIVGDSRRTAQETKNAMPRGGIVTTPQPKVGREATVSGAGVVRATSRDPLRQGLPQKPLLGNAYASADGYSLSAGSHQNLSFGQAAQIYDGVNPPAESCRSCLSFEFPAPRDRPRLLLILTYPSQQGLPRNWIRIGRLACQLAPGTPPLR